MKFRWFLMTCAATFAQSAKGDGRPPGSALAAGEPLTWQRGRRNCWKTDSAARRDHLRHGPSGGRGAVQ